MASTRSFGTHKCPQCTTPLLSGLVFAKKRTKKGGFERTKESTVAYCPNRLCPGNQTQYPVKVGGYTTTYDLVPVWEITEVKVVERPQREYVWLDPHGTDATTLPPPMPDSKR